MEMNGRLVVPIKREFRDSVGGIVHDASRSGNTVYVEPTFAIDKTNDLRRIEAELRGEESRVWRMLTGEIYDRASDLEGNVACLGQLDVVLARVGLGRRLGRGAGGGEVEEEEGRSYPRWARRAWCTYGTRCIRSCCSGRTTGGGRTGGGEGPARWGGRWWGATSTSDVARTRA